MPYNIWSRSTGENYTLEQQIQKLEETFGAFIKDVARGEITRENKIHLIKAWRACSGTYLKEAKDDIEEWYNNPSSRFRESMPTPPPITQQDRLLSQQQESIDHLARRVLALESDYSTINQCVSRLQQHQTNMASTSRLIEDRFSAIVSDVQTQINRVDERLIEVENVFEPEAESVTTGPLGIQGTVGPSASLGGTITLRHTRDVVCNHPDCEMCNNAQQENLSRS